MGQTFIVACNRCGAPNSEFATDWVYTKDKVWLHACADGIMGGAKEFEVWESRPVLAPTPRQPIPIEPSSPKVYLVPGGLYHQRHGRHFTQCHGCPLELSGDEETKGHLMAIGKLALENQVTTDQEALAKASEILEALVENIHEYLIAEVEELACAAATASSLPLEHEGEVVLAKAS